MIPTAARTSAQADIDAVVEVLRSDFLTQGPAGPALRAGGRRDVSARGTRSRSTARLGACTSPAWRSDSGPAIALWTVPNHLRRLGQLRALLRRGRRFRRHRSAHLQPERASAGGKARSARNAPARCPRSWCRCTSPASRATWRRSGRSRSSTASGSSRTPRTPIGGRVSRRRAGRQLPLVRDITVFSFHPVKIITTGRRRHGADQRRGARRSHAAAAHARHHARCRRDDAAKSDAPAPGTTSSSMLGYNYRMTDLQAALGVSQLQRLDEFVARRHELARALRRAAARAAADSCPAAVRTAARPSTCTSSGSRPRARARRTARSSIDCAQRASA